MGNYRDALPQLGNEIFLTDGGCETELIFIRGVDLPEFASFPLLDTDDGRAHLRDYSLAYMAIAAEARVGFIAETPTWRANTDWGAKLGYDPAALARVNRDGVEFVVALRDEFPASLPFVVSGCIGPRGDGYNPSELMTAGEAAGYHAAQIDVFAAAGVDLVSALTMTHPGEAIGVTRAAQAAHVPVVISFTLETDGRLPCATSLGDAIAEVDDATGAGPAYYMINCAHPDHFDAVLEPDAPWAPRLRGIRANASRQSHAELDEAEELDAGDPEELGAQYAALRRKLDHVTVLGGCCGTDARHVAAIRAACID